MNETITQVHYEVEYRDDFEGWTRFGEWYKDPEEAKRNWPSYYATGDLKIIKVVTTESEVVD